LKERLIETPDVSASQVVEQIGSVNEATAAMEQIDQMLRANEDPLLGARLCKLAQLIGERFPRHAAHFCLSSMGGEDVEKAMFARVARAVRRQGESGGRRAEGREQGAESRERGAESREMGSSVIRRR